MSHLAELRARALAARAANDAEGAVAAWRLMLDLTPDDWRLALELREDLRAGWHYPDSDQWFRRAARHLPDAEWLEHYSDLHVFHGNDLDAIDRRARLLLSAAPGDASLYGILGDVARQRRDWVEAVRAFTAAAHLDPLESRYREKARSAELYRQLSWRRWDAAGPAYAAYLVNLDRNTERMVQIQRDFASAPISLHRQPGIEGTRLPAAAVQRLTGDAAAPRGTLGCFLSHAAAWEALIASGDSHGLILEDDVIPLMELPASLDCLRIPAGFDLCFVNDRLEPRIGSTADQDARAVSLAATMALFHPHENAPGADGYILSREGAAKLLAWIAADGMADDVDWRMLAYALTPAEIDGIPRHAFARQRLEELRAAIPRDDRLRAYALHPALIRTVGVSSDREDQNRLLRAGILVQEAGQWPDVPGQDASSGLEEASTTGAPALLAAYWDGAGGQPCSGQAFAE